MRTMTQIRTEEGAARAKAGRYERLIGMRTALRNQVVALERADRQSATGIIALQKIAAQVEQVPAGLLTRSRSLQGIPIVTGGQEVRTALTNIASDALADLQRQADRYTAELASVRARLEQVNTELQEFAE